MTRLVPGQIPDRLVVAEPLTDGGFDLEGHHLVALDLGQTDTDDTTRLHVPDIGRVVAGDAVYNDVHLYLAESDPGRRKAWIAAIDTIEALNPRAVVSGHKRAGRPDDPHTLEETRRYIRDFDRVAAATTTARDLYDQMLAIYPDRVNPGCALAFGAGGPTMTRFKQPEGNTKMPNQPSIVLVHGAWADGSSWSSVIERLQAAGYRVTAPQFPLTALADDVARLREVLDFQEGPTVVAGHSYGGQIMTALGTNAPNVVALVYIAAFGLDEGESLGALLSQGPVTPALEHLFTDQRGFAWLSEDDFVSHFAADVDPAKARVLYAAQQPLAGSAFGDVMGVPAWKSLPTWYLVSTNDEAIPPEAEMQFAKRMGANVIEVPSSHVPMVSHPDAVAQLIETAAETVGVRA